jgi:photosystem II stability/assembly factor-like uncharacterized protein
MEYNKIKNYSMRILIIICTLFLVIICSCKKQSGDLSTNPISQQTPSFNPDTLSAGWSKIVINSASSVGFSDIFFLNNNLGYTTSISGTYKTINGGVNWNIINTVGFTNLFVVSNGNIFGTKRTNSIYKSIDGGINFAANSVSTTDYEFADIFAVDDNNIFTYGLNGVYNSNNGGLTWTRMNSSPGSSGSCDPYSTLFFRDLNTGWVASGRIVYRKINNGAGWSSFQLPDITSGCNYISSIYAPSNDIVFLGNTNGILYKSNNGGQSFSIVKDFGKKWFMDVHFIDENIGYVCLGTKIFRTTDGGGSWSTVVAMGSTTFTEIHFNDSTHGWATCASEGIILKFN